MKSVFHNDPAHLSINNNNTLKPTITNLHFTVAQRYFKPFRMETKSSPVSCPSVLYHSSCSHSAFPVPGKHHSCSPYPQAVALKTGTQQPCNSWNHQIIAQMLITCHEEFITTLPGRGSSRTTTRTNSAAS